MLNSFLRSKEIRIETKWEEHGKSDTTKHFYVWCRNVGADRTKDRCCTDGFWGRSCCDSGVDYIRNEKMWKRIGKPRILFDEIVKRRSRSITWEGYMRQMAQYDMELDSKRDEEETTSETVDGWNDGSNEQRRSDGGGLAGWVILVIEMGKTALIAV